MTTVRIAPPTVGICDILEYAKAAIEEYGWRQGPRPNPAGSGENDRKVWEKEILPHGLSLHDAVGYACVVLSGEVAIAPTSRRNTGKEFPTGDRATDYGYGGTMRGDVYAAIVKHLPRGEDDQSFNDKADDVQAVIAVLDATMKEECK